MMFDAVMGVVVEIVAKMAMWGQCERLSPGVHQRYFPSAEDSVVGGKRRFRKIGHNAKVICLAAKSAKETGNNSALRSSGKYFSFDTLH
jgi:hypothetical protein